MKFIGWLLGLDGLTSIEQIPRVTLAAPWASEGTGKFWVFLGSVTLFAIALLMYSLLQPRGHFAYRMALGVGRGLLLTLLLITLADPVLTTVGAKTQHPYLYVLFDGTDSMAIADEFPSDVAARLAEAVDLREEAKPGPASKDEGESTKDENDSVSRVKYVQALLRKDKDNLLKKLQDEKMLRIAPFVFDGNSTSTLRKLNVSRFGGEKVDPDFLAGQLTTSGQVTALGSVLAEVTQQFGTGNLAGVVLVSDFAHNSGAAPVGSRGGRELSPAVKLGVPVYTVGVGAAEAVDLAVDVQTDPKMKKAEKTSVLVKLRQTGLQGESVSVKVTARRLSGEGGEGPAEIVVGEKTVTLTSAVDSVDFPFTPKESGRFEFIAEVAPVAGEIVEQNNRVTREVNIIDDYLRLMYVANEPSWEWRFVKEVFHRDKLVGMQGFRTFLGSSDPRVRESNILFLSTMTPKRSEFFANDVIFLGDMPQASLSPRFCEMTKEFVSNFGGGLVVIGGPRFGPKELYGSPLADMLPVILDPEARLDDQNEFRLQLTSHASRYSFMRLGPSDVENQKAWNNLGPLPWYQPIAQIHEQGVVLAEHPTDLCRDGKTKQPLIAVRQYGAGEVVYLGFDETWRMRRRYGEKYYREFWSQLIYRLGMSHALGSEKRFVAKADRQQYRAEEKVRLTIEAYDQNFEPLTEDKLSGRVISAELTIPGKGETAALTRPISVPMLRGGVFETQIPVYQGGEYSLRVKDPVSGKSQEIRFDVTDLSAERRSAVRNVRLQEDLASETRGRSYDLTTVSRLIDDLDPKPITEKLTRVRPLWSTPLWFLVLAGLLLGEWLFRKLIRLS
jgi:hypothetical protein